MNINNIAATVKTIPFETRMPASAETSTPVSPPTKIDALEKINSQVSETKGGNQKETKAKEEQKNSFSAEEVKQLAAEMNEIMDDLQTRLGFSIREDLNNQVIVEITDRETDELIKQIPSEELLAFKEKMEEFSGLIFDQTI